MKRDKIPMYAGLIDQGHLVIHGWADEDDDGMMIIL